ncbi:hypothetical protein DKT88_22645 [Escherichia coli]|nr:hypothetical protein [Escherichia coli]EFO3295069.1 hypothetical protein [Escherichia coli]EFO4136436.1 hypothetical protein [Escherichia coli]RFA95533.1 hypothetical protein CA147_13590 [Escherichia coli]
MLRVFLQLVSNIYMRLFSYKLTSARSYPRHACSLHIVVFMQSHELFKASPELECLDINDPFAIMHFHAL